MLKKITIVFLYLIIASTLLLIGCKKQEAAKEPEKAITFLESAECIGCHTDYFKTNYSEKLAVRIDHVTHVEQRKYDCAECHSAVAHGDGYKDKNPPTMYTCFKCHNDNLANRQYCVYCHVVVQEMKGGFAVTEIKGVTDPMFIDVHCLDCHLEQGDKIMPVSGDTCNNCHKDKSYSDKLREITVDVKMRLHKLRNLLAELTARSADYEKAGGERTAEFERGIKLLEQTKAIGRNDCREHT